jgi:6-phosphogluconate dehydrogenase
MQLGMIGLGRMGANMARRLLRKGHDCVVWSLSAEEVAAVAADGAVGAASVEDLVRKLKPPRAIWMMLPVPAVEGTIERLAPLLARGDCLIDGGNSPFEEGIRRAARLAPAGISD